MGELIGEAPPEIRGLRRLGPVSSDLARAVFLMRNQNHVSVVRLTREGPPVAEKQPATKGSADTAGEFDTVSAPEAIIDSMIPAKRDLPLVEVRFSEEAVDARSGATS